MHSSLLGLDGVGCWKNTSLARVCPTICSSEVGIKNAVRSHWTPGGFPMRAACNSFVTCFLLFLNPNKVEREHKPMRSCRKSRGTITPTPHANASRNRRAIDVTAAHPRTDGCEPTFPGAALTTRSSFTPPRKHGGGMHQPFVCEANLRGAAAAMWQSSPGCWGCWSLALSFLCLLFPPPSPHTHYREYKPSLPN